MFDCSPVLEYAKIRTVLQSRLLPYQSITFLGSRVSHEKLLFKLECLGIGGSLLAWFRSYLSGRRQTVLIDSEPSDFLPETSGVPQGLILGPLLFLLFINDMPNAIAKETSLPLFADDSNCFRLILGRDDGDKLQDDLIT